MSSLTIEQRVQQLETRLKSIDFSKYVTKEELKGLSEMAEGLDGWQYFTPSQFATIDSIQDLELRMGKIEGDIQNLEIYYVTKKELDEVNRKIGSLPEGETDIVGYVDNLQEEVAALKAAAKIYKLPYTGAEFGAKLAKI